MSVDVFSRLADIRTGAVGAEEELHIITNMDGGRIGPGGEAEIAAFSFQELVPTITLFSPFRDLDDIFRKGPGHNEVGQLVYLRLSRQAQLLHELIHFVTNKIHYPPIVPKYKDSAAVDVKLADACGWGEKKWIFNKADLVFESKEELERAVAYGEFKTLLLAQLKKGPRYAVHNADSYAMFAIVYEALLVNWNLNGAIMPQRGEPVFWLKTAVRRDPFAQLPPIFDIPGEWRYKYFWGRTGRNVGIVSDDDD
ncbi:hypothetical protein HYALB_00012589 [Hymenoscyphus albidus]|uniref:Uncharacterized protein n=1 Tax=Hymenoscyphus albidus TaxID=595503 RepID=A0A9N9LRW3_9HELO|nr:hypothetical protein HYALB_00012589 [Hymenoscyphus albidus]